jgi:hypothetical protein
MLARDRPEAQADEAPGDDTAPPDWIREAWRVTVADLRAFVRTAATFVAHPRRFAAGWAAGRERALNPLAFLATSAAVLGGAQALFGLDHGGSIAYTLLALIAPYAHFAFLGLVAHLCLRVLGSHQRLRASLGIALYVGGGPALAFTLAFYAVTGVMMAATHAASVEEASAHLAPSLTLAVGAGLYIGFIAVVGSLGAALVGAHGCRTWKGVAAIAAALAVSGVVYGFWRPPGTVGAHFVLWLSRPGPYFSLRY